MSNNSTGGGLLLVLLLSLCVLYYNIKIKKNQTQSPKVSVEQQLNSAEANGIKYSHTMASIRADLQKLQDSGILSLVIKPGKLPNPILGQTTVSINSDGKIEAVVVMDVEEAIAAGDMEEPLLGHELKHVWDALFLYDKSDPLLSVAKFVEVANKQKANNVLYQAREVESSAIGIEDSIRRELVSSNNRIFSDLPRSRQAADVLYSRRMKPNLSL